MKNHFVFLLLLGSFLTAGILFGQEAPSGADIDPKATALLEASARRINAIQTMVVDYAINAAGAPFIREGQVILKRPNLYRVERIRGMMTEVRTVMGVSDGNNVWSIDRTNFIGYKKPFRAENFHVGVNPLVQYFFQPMVNFDPTDPVWGHSVSVFDTNRDAYNRFVTVRYGGERDADGIIQQIIEVRYNSQSEDLRQTYFLDEQGLIVQIDTYTGGKTVSIRFRNYQIDGAVAAESFAYQPPAKLPVQDSDPVRLGELAPDLELPLNTGGTVRLKELMKGKRGILISTLDGMKGYGVAGPDAYLRHMKVLQTIRDKYVAQGLEIVVVVGSTQITPDVKVEMMRNWMPDTSRFNYPIAIDLDLERGIQGSAYVNFRLNGRTNVLLDSDGRVVFACNDFDRGRINEVALYQALGQIGFSVSPAELEGLLR